jgi:hypothetical protein
VFVFNLVVKGVSALGQNVLYNHDALSVVVFEFSGQTGLSIRVFYRTVLAIS